MIMIGIRDKLIQSALDSGSSVTLLDHDFAMGLNLKCRESKLVLRTANGTLLKNHGQVRLNFRLGLVDFNFNVILVKGLAIQLKGNKMLIGNDFMQKFGLKIDFANKELSFQNGSEMVQLPFIDNNNIVCNEKVTIKRRVFIPARSVKKILIRIKVQNGFYVVESDDQKILFDDSLINVKNELAWLIVENPSYEKFILWPNQVIGNTSIRVCKPEFEKEINWVQDDPGVLKLHEDSIAEISYWGKIKGDHKDKLFELLYSYKDCFSEEIIKDKAKFPMELDFELKSDKPVYVRPYRTNFLQRQHIKSEVDKLLKTGVIEPSMSPYCSPFMVIKKADGKSYRCVCDLRKINELVLPMKYPLPNLNSLLEKAEGGTYYSSFDLSQGYHQADVIAEKRKCLAFSVPGGLFQYRKVPMGLNTSGAFFQMCMESMFNGLQDEVLIYLDDLLVVTKGSFEDHLEVLTKVFERCRKYGLSLKGSKTKLCGQEVKFLGHYINKNEIKTDPEKIRAIQDFKIPENKTDVRSFKGMVNFYYRFCPELGVISQPLNQNCGKNTPFHWGREQQEAFEKIKSLMTSNVVLAHYNPEARIRVYSDASDKGIGGVINIETEKGTWRPLAYCSRTLTEREKRLYTITEKEILGILFVAEKFRFYLYGKGKIEFFTDHSAIVFLLNKQKELTGRLNRWILKIRELQEYVEFKYKPGKENVLADCLSRNPVTESKKEKRGPKSKNVTPSEEKDSYLIAIEGKVKSVPDVTENSKKGVKNVKKKQVIKKKESIYLVSVDEKNKFRQIQSSDSFCKGIIQIIQKEETSVTEKRKVKKYQLENGILFRKSRGNVGREILQLVVPAVKENEVISLFHDGKNYYHGSVNRTIYAIQQGYYIRMIQDKVKNYVKTCRKCQLYKESKKFPYGELTERVFPKNKKCWQLDTTGKFLPDKKGMCYIISIIETFSGFVVSKAVKNIKIPTMIKFVRAMKKEFSIGYLRTDLHSVFTSEKFVSFCKQNKIRLIRSLGFSPQCNGKIEALHHQTKIRMAMKMEKEMNNWSSYLPEITHSLNMMPEEVSKLSPYQVFYGKKFVVDDGEKFPIKDSGRNNLSRDEKKFVNNKVTETRHKQFLRNKKGYDKKHINKVFNIDELVKVTNLSYEPGLNKSFKQKFTGPWKVLDRIGVVTYLVKLLSHPNMIRKVHISRLREYYER
jgi:transposase InsO family protein